MSFFCYHDDLIWTDVAICQFNVVGTMCHFVSLVYKCKTPMSSAAAIYLSIILFTPFFIKYEKISITVVFSAFPIAFSGPWWCYREEDKSGLNNWYLWWTNGSWPMQHDCWKAWWLSHWTGSLIALVCHVIWTNLLRFYANSAAFTDLLFE